MVLSMLPRPPRRIDTGSLEARLRERGISVHRRTIQRDLIELATVFPIVADERAKPYGWRWADHAHPILPDVACDARATPPIDVTLRLVRPLLSTVAAELRASPRDIVEVDGLVQVTLSVADSTTAKRALYTRAHEVEVVQPRRLRQEIYNLAERAMQRHQLPTQVSCESK